MIDHDEANEILNKFQGWEPGRRCDGWADDNGYFCNKCAWYSHKDVEPQPKFDMQHGWLHDVAQFDYFADTPEAREAVRLVKDEFVRRTAHSVVAYTELPLDSDVVHFVKTAQTEFGPSRPIESHALALALAAALKENRK